MITCNCRHLEARCRERGYALEEVMPCIVKQDGDQWTIDTKHPAYPYKKPGEAKETSRVKKVCTWIKAVNRWMKAGRPIRGDEEVARLVAICKRCKHYSDKGRCRACGCAVTRGAWAVTNKARMATEDCPKGEWPLVSTSAVEGHSDTDQQEHDGHATGNTGEHRKPVGGFWHRIVARLIGDGRDPEPRGNNDRQRTAGATGNAGDSTQVVHDLPPQASVIDATKLFAVPVISQAPHVETKQHADEFARALAEVERIKPAVLVEIGVHAGGSLLRYASACAPNAIVIGVDVGERPEAASIPGVIERLRGEGYDAHWIKGLSQSPGVIQEARRLLAGRPIDCLHIDGSHKTADVLADWRNWVPLVRPGGMVIFHDVASRSNGVPAAWRRCREGLAWLEIVLSGPERYRTGTGIVWLPGEQPETLAQLSSDDLRISAIMPARQEGDQVRLTCESFLAAGVDEIVVIDDGSTDGSCDKLPEGVVVIRNEKPQGVGRARNQGAAAATGDVLIFADAHERALTSLRPFAQAAMDRGAILCAAVKPLEGGSKGPGGKRAWTGYGARKILDKDAVAYKEKWNLTRPKERYSPLDALIGACYAVPREVFDRMGGWIETRQWGYNEQAFSIKAWFCGVPMLVDRDTVIRHEFKRRFKYPCSRSGSQLNRWHVHAVLFDAATNAETWAPRFAKAFGAKVEAMARALLAEPDVQAEIADFRRRKIRTDADFLAAFPPGRAPSKPVPKPRDRHVQRR